MHLLALNAVRNIAEPCAFSPQEQPGSNHLLYFMIVPINTSPAVFDPSIFSNEIALDEALDALDPLRHLRIDESLGDPQCIVPIQPRSTRNELIRLSFPSPCSTAIHIAIKVDASPGCGGIAWPAGEVRISSSTTHSNAVTKKIAGASELFGLSRRAALHWKISIGAWQWHWFSWTRSWQVRRSCLDH